MKRLRSLILLLLTYTCTLQAQDYPVIASTQIIPPYSLYVPDYYTGAGEQLRVILLQRDLTQPGYDVSLQMTLERNGTVIMRTSPSYHPPAITLAAGVPVIISGTALADYFSVDHLLFSGTYSREEYERTKSLPEGSYRLTFQAYDRLRPEVQVSNAIASVFFLQKSDPPLLNFPICGSRVEKREPQSLVFNWSNRNTSQAGTSYNFSLYEIKPAGSNPDHIVRSTRPLYTTTTDNTTILYGPAAPPLTDSLQYAWIVQAIDKEGKDLYKNQGFSQSSTFTYLGSNPFENAARPVLYGMANGERQIRYHWPATAVDGYRLQYRAVAKNNVAYDWQTIGLSTDTTAVISSLEPDREYEAQLQWKLAGVYSQFSALLTIKTPALQSIVCGNATSLSLPANRQVQPILTAGNIIRIGHYDVLLTTLNTGRIITPGLGFGLAVYCRNIVVNTDLVAISGEMHAVTKGIGQFIKEELDAQHGGDDMGQVKTGDLVADITTHLHLFTREGIVVDTVSRTITLKDSEDGSTQAIRYTTLPLLLEDADGNIYQVSQQGAVHEVGRRNMAWAVKAASFNQLRLSDGRVDFTAAADNKYAFDVFNAGYPAAYESLADGQYRVSAKAIIPGARETIIAHRSDTTPVLFVNGKGIVFPSRCAGNDCSVTITGGPAADAQELYAIHPDGSSVGKLLIPSYPALQKKVVLIPVGEHIAIPENAIKQVLATVYGRLGITYTVETDNSFKGNSAWDLDQDGVLEDSKSALLSNGFTGEERAMKKAYIQSHQIANDQVYLFVVNEGAREDVGLLGKMPRKSQFGFVWLKGGTDQEIARTVAHEIGHGMYTLAHVVNSSGRVPDKSLNDGDGNLMTTGTGLALYKFQWDIVHDPGSVWGIFEEDAGSELTKGLSLYKCLQKDVQSALTSSLYYAPDSTVVKLPAGAVPLSVFYDDIGKNSPAMPGSLNSFEYGGKEYNAIYFVSNGRFKGYSYEKYDSSSYIYAHSHTPGGEINRIDFGKDMFTCEVKVNGVSYPNDGCICQDNFFTQQYKRYMREVIGSEQPAVQAEIAAICKTIFGLPGDVLATSRELFSYYYENPALYYIDWNTSPDVFTFDQLKRMHQQYKELDSSIQRLKRCDFNTGNDVVDFVNAKFVTPGTKTSFLSRAPFTRLTAEARACLIAKLLTGDYGQRWSATSSEFGGQNIMLEIVSNCASTGELYKVIKTLQREHLLYRFLSDTYDFLYLSKGNFTQLCNAITIAILDEEKPGQDLGLISQLMKERKWLVFDDGYLTASNAEAFRDAEQKIALEVRDGMTSYLNVVLPILGGGSTALFPDYGSINPFKGKFNPLDYVILIPKRDVKAFGATLEKGIPYVLPAISVYQLFKMDTKSALETSAGLVLNTGLCAVGMEGMMGAESVVTGWEMLNVGLTDFVTYANAAPELVKDHPEFVEYVNYLALAYTVGTLTVGTVKGIRNARINVPVEMMEAMFAEDALETVHRTVSMGKEQALTARRILGNMNDNKVYLALHSEGETVNVIENGIESSLAHKSLHKYILERKIPMDKELVVLTAGNEETVQKLCDVCNRPIITNIGAVEISENRVIEAEQGFRKLMPASKASEIVRVGVDEAPRGSKVVLGELLGEEELADRIYENIRKLLKIAGEKDMWFSKRNMWQLVKRGKELGLGRAEIEDIIFNACNRRMYSLEEVMSQLEKWESVKREGFPVLFSSLREFDEFGELLKGLAKEWGLPEGRIYVQGSALRMDDPGDLDVTIRVEEAEFESIRSKYRSSVKIKVILDNFGVGGKISGYNIYRGNDNFTKKFLELYFQKSKASTITKIRNANIQISVVKKGGKIDIGPYLKL
ncbi:fibronectin type III domain-containing protein [Chitinophaga sp.]|uniref:fibronectin type III domain-containing protein n=1 Tax=Chitinophaga sp. TaxID=1869181 RepID=UPI0031DFD822